MEDADRSFDAEQVWTPEDELKIRSVIGRQMLLEFGFDGLFEVLTPRILNRWKAIHGNSDPIRHLIREDGPDEARYFTHDRATKSQFNHRIKAGTHPFGTL